MAIFLHAQALNEGNADKVASYLARDVKVYRLAMDSLTNDEALMAEIEKAAETDDFERVAKLIHPELTESHLKNDAVIFDNSDAVREMLAEDFKEGPTSQMDILWHQKVGNKVFAFERKKMPGKVSDLLSVYQVEGDLITAIWITVARRAEVAACNGLLK